MRKKPDLLFFLRNLGFFAQNLGFCAKSVVFCAKSGCLLRKKHISQNLGFFTKTRFHDEIWFFLIKKQIWSYVCGVHFCRLLTQIDDLCVAFRSVVNIYRFKLMLWTRSFLFRAVLSSSTDFISVVLSGGCHNVLR